MSTTKITFSNESIRKLICPSDKRRIIVHDKKQPKLVCRVTANGTKTFALHAWDSRNEMRIQYTIGKYPVVSINQARDITKKLLAQIASGIDIVEASRRIKEEPTVDVIFKNWLINHAQEEDNRTWPEAERSYYRHIQPYFGNKKISSVTKQRVRSWRSKLLKKPRQRKKGGKTVMLSKTTVNRQFALLKTIYNKEADHILNPCAGIKPYKEKSRNRWLKPDQLRQFFKALDDIKTPEYLRDFIYLALNTGARRSNLMSMAWKEIDFTSKTWTIPASKSKNKEEMTIPLIDQAMDILNRRKRRTRSIFIFPGTGKSGHLVEPKKAWRTLVQRSGLTDLRLHDLRRTCGSYQVRGGSSLVVIGKSLGQKSISTTQVYAKVDDDPVRTSMEQMAEEYDNARNSTPKVVSIEKK